MARKTKFSTHHLDALPSFLKSAGLDRILLGGDFTTSSLPAEFAIAQTFVNQLPTPWIAVPGNHDRYTFRACREKRFYHYFKHNALREQGVEMHNLGSNWHLIALDTAKATPFYTSSGLFAEAQERELKKILAQLPVDAKILMLNHYPFFQNDTPGRSLVRASALEALIQKERRIKAYLHGHTHRHTIADLQPSGMPIILDGGCVADMEKGSWNLLELDDKGMTIDVMQWKGTWKAVRQVRIEWTR